jgi:uncharacterized protein YecE (DUF72 family)
MSSVRIGTSGWNYPSGRGTWNRLFYPASKGRPKTFDELSFYAEHFNTVEVNSTFYGQPRAEVTRAWAQRTPAGFDFSVKLYQKFTHPGMYRQRVARAVTTPLLPMTAGSTGVDAETISNAVDAITRPNQADLDEFRRGIDPLASAGKMGALLAQFPASFKHGEMEQHYLEQLLRALEDYPVAVELRHSSWSTRFSDTLATLNAFRAAWVQIDEPKFRLSIRQNFLPNVEGFYYMRLHGRNAEKWWRHDKSEDRYDYLYTSGELQEFVDTVDAARRIVKKVYLYSNNHFSAKSVVNAAMIKHQLGEPVEGDYPSTMIDAYPQLAEIVNQPAARPMRTPGAVGAEVVKRRTP